MAETAKKEKQKKGKRRGLKKAANGVQIIKVKKDARPLGFDGGGRKEKR